MNERIAADLSIMTEKLKVYVETDRMISFSDVKEEPIIAVKPGKTRIQPLKKCPAATYLL